MKNGNVTIFGAGIEETVIGKSGEWIRLKIVYMNPKLDYTGDGKQDIICRVYLNGSSVETATGYQPYSSSSYYDPLKLIKYRFTTDSNLAGEICLDNTKIWQMTLPLDENGFPVVDDEPIGAPEKDPYDKDGWS